MYNYYAQEVKAIRDFSKKEECFLCFFNSDTFKADKSVSLELLKQLSLPEYMTLKEIVSSLALIESIMIGKQSLGELMNGGDKPYRVLKDLLVADTKFTNDLIQTQNNVKAIQAKLTRDSKLLPTLMKLHQKLVNSFDQYYFKLQSNSPVEEFEYTSKTISDSQFFNELINTTSKETLANNRTIVKDLQRGTTINNKSVIPAEFNNLYDHIVVKAIEELTNDEVKSKGSKASKIMHFGHQYLQAILLNEVLNTLKLKKQADKKGNQYGQTEIAFGKCISRMNWTAKEGHVYGEFTIDMLSLSDNNNPDNQYIMVMANDGVSLTKAVSGSDEVILLMERLNNASASPNESQYIFPIVTFKGKVSVEINRKTWEHFLKVSEFKVKINTEDLTFKNSGEYKDVAEIERSFSIRPNLS